MSYSQYECCTVAVLFFVFSEFTFSLKAAISSSIYVTTDTGASSVAELCLFVYFSNFLVQAMILSLPGTYPQA